MSELMFPMKIGKQVNITSGNPFSHALHNSKGNNVIARNTMLQKSLSKGLASRQFISVPKDCQGHNDADNDDDYFYEEFCAPTVGELSHSERTEEDGLSTRTESILLSPHQLVNKLAQVNQSGSDFDKIHRSPERLKRQRRARKLTIQDLTQLLRHVNVCEATGQEINWTKIYDSVYVNEMEGNRLELKIHGFAEDDDTMSVHDLETSRDLYSSRSLIRTSNSHMCAWNESIRTQDNGMWNRSINNLKVSMLFGIALKQSDTQEIGDEGFGLEPDICSIKSDITLETNLVEEVIEIVIDDGGDEEHDYIEEIVTTDDDSDDLSSTDSSRCPTFAQVLI